MISKYRAVPTVIDNIRFASKAEALYYQQLKIMEKAGMVRELELQPKFALVVPVRGGGPPQRVGHYIADFRFREGPRGDLRIVDVKGMKTPIYRLKKKMVEAIYGITITEVSA